MTEKRFFLAAVLCAAVLLAGAAALTFWADPLLTAGPMGPEDTALFVNERYEMAGLIRRQDYSAVVMGTSLAANYRASWFTEGLGEPTLKITYPDGWIHEFDTALDLAFRTHPGLDTVYFCLDPNILIRPDGRRTVQLPEYLYNDNPLDDLQVYLSADALSMAARTLWARKTGTAVTLDEAYVWDGTVYFARETALAGYKRPERSDTVLPADAYLAAADENLDVICGWIEEHPEVRFVVWFPPYSVLYWDKADREGTTEAVITAVERGVERLLEYDNAAVHCFLRDIGTITDLNNYADHIHCSGAVTRRTAEYMMNGQWRLTRENYREHLDGLRQFAAEYDYDSIFADQTR